MSPGPGHLWMLPGPFAGGTANPGEPPMKNVAKTVRLPAALWAALELAAKDDQRTVNGMIWHLLDAALGGPRAAEGGEHRKAPEDFGDECAGADAWECRPLDGWGEP